MQVENQSGNIRGRIIVVEEVQDPDNVNGTLSLNTVIFCAIQDAKNLNTSKICYLTSSCTAIYYASM